MIVFITFDYRVNTKNIYLDYAASTPVSEKVLKKMLPFFTNHFGNSSSATHQHGWYANGAIKRARKQVAKAINCEESEIIFTSGATEGINQAIRAIYQLYHKKGNHIVVSKTGLVMAAEDRDNMEICGISKKTNKAFPIVRIKGHHKKSEVTGPAFDPSGTRLYFSSQRGKNGFNGITYEVKGHFNELI